MTAKARRRDEGLLQCQSNPATGRQQPLLSWQSVDVRGSRSSALNIVRHLVKQTSLRRRPRTLGLDAVFGPVVLPPPIICAMNPLRVEHRPSLVPRFVPTDVLGHEPELRENIGGKTVRRSSAPEHVVQWQEGCLYRNEGPDVAGP